MPRCLGGRPRLADFVGLVCEGACEPILISRVLDMSSVLLSDTSLGKFVIAERMARDVYRWLGPLDF